MYSGSDALAPPQCSGNAKNVRKPILIAKISEIDCRLIPTGSLLLRHSVLLTKYTPSKGEF